MTGPPHPLPEDPKVCAMLLCDHAHRDTATGKYSLLGIMDRIHVRAPFPTNHGPFSVYCNLTNLNGSYALELQCLRAADESVVAQLRTETPITVKDPLGRVEFGFNLPGLPLPDAGRYVFRLLANGRVLQDTALVVVKAEGPAAR